MDNSGLDMSLEEDTSSMDEIAPKCPMKPQKKNKGVALSCYIHLSLLWLIGQLSPCNLLHPPLTRFPLILITVRKPRVARPCSPITTPNLPLKKKSKEGKGKPC